MKPYSSIIVVVDNMHSNISVVQEQLAVSSHTMNLPLVPPPIDMVVVKPAMPEFDFRPLREKPRRDWEQRQPGKRRRR